MTLVIFLVILSFLVIIHELGHFLMAKRAGMKVEEFGMGYPPRMLTLYTDKQGTAYTLNWLPFGGFVRLYGEDGAASTAKSGKEADKSGLDEDASGGAFFSKPVSARLAVVLAGATINFVFGALAFGVIYSHIGVPTDFDYVVIEEVEPGSPAEVAGIQPGDEVSSVRVRDEVIPTMDVDEFIDVVTNSRGETVDLVLQNRDAVIPVYVRKVEEIPEGQGSLGVVVNDFDFVKYPMWQMPFRGMWVGTKSAVEFGSLLLSEMGKMIAKLLLHGQVPQEVAGPVGIVHQAGKQGILEQGWIGRVNFAAILSINLAIVNVLPFPALDGGRAVFLVYEAIFRRKINPDIERKVNAFGFASLLLLIILITFRDVRNLALERGWF